jgi:disulfide bond formation protein DsbB
MMASIFDRFPPTIMVAWLGLGSGFMLGMAYFFEFGMGLLPCTMCYWQRIPHGLVIALAAVTLLPFTPLNPKAMLLFLGIILAIGGGIAAWHGGVELGILPGPTACSGGIALDGSPSALLDQLLAAPVIRCDEVPWSLFGLSMANWNMLISLGMAMTALACLKHHWK